MLLPFCSFLVYFLATILFGFDGAILSVTASPISVNSNGTVTVDDDASIITFTGDWTVLRNNSYSDGSSSYTTTPGDSFSLRFNGTSIDYYGFAMTDGAQFRVMVDGQHVGTCKSAVSNSTTPTPTVLWTNTTLSGSEHVFQIVHNDTAGKYLTVDKLAFIAFGPIPTSLLADQGAASTSTTSLPSSSATEAASTTTNKASKNVGVIVGGVIGGVLALALLLALLVFLYRRERNPRAVPTASDKYPFAKQGYSNMGNAVSGGTGAGGVLGTLGSRVTGGWAGNRKRGSGRSGATGSTAYEEDIKPVVPHLYNSYSSEAATSHPLTSFKDNTISSTGPAVPFQIPVSSDSQPSPVQRTRTRSQSLSSIHKALPSLPNSRSPNQSPAREVDFTSPSTGERVYTHPFNSHFAAGGFVSSGSNYHPYAPYASDYTRPSSMIGGGSVGRPSFDQLQKGSAAFGSTSSLKLDRNGGSEDYKGDLSLSRHISSSSATSLNGTLSLSGVMMNQSYSRQGQIGGGGASTNNSPNKTSMHPMTFHNNSTNSLSYYPDATTADGLARSYQPTVLARPDSRASSVSSKRFSNQLFSR